MVCLPQNMAHNSIWYIFLKWLESKTIVIWLILRTKWSFWGFFLEFMALSRIKKFKLGLFATKLVTQHYLVYIIVLKLLQSKTIVICLILRAKLSLWGFFNVFGTFSHKVVQTWFFCHKTCHTTVFCIYYCFEMIRVKNNIHMLDITC